MSKGLSTHASCPMPHPVPFPLYSPRLNRKETRVNYTLTEWLNLAFRWTHVFAAIMWVGQTFLFTWLDHTLSKEGQVWMVHSGGFYIVDKQKVPEMLPKTLHWFKWEAAITWLSGVSLFIL